MCGDSADNLTFKAHRLAGTGGMFELSLNRHLGNQNIDTTTATISKSDWHDIVASLPNGNSAFDSACSSAFGSTWYGANILTPGLRDELRGLISDLVNP